ncbi:MAG TPA: hypothetical protein VGM90_38080 [Kofleriaceae bacterium]|jgi:hypothetical protein
MRTILAMGQTGNFTVSEDPESVYADALQIVLAPQNADQWKIALAPESTGHGLKVDGFGSVSRVTDRYKLPAPLRDDLELVLDGDTWFVHIEKTHSHSHPRHALIDGVELRELVQDGAALRIALKAPIA